MSYHTLREHLKEGVIGKMIMMSGLQLHEAGSIPKDYPKSVGRFFYREEFTLKDHNRKGNTVNKRLGRFKEYIDPSIETTLGLKDIDEYHGVSFGK